jgi:hypothetical protein
VIVGRIFLVPVAPEGRPWMHRALGERRVLRPFWRASRAAERLGNDCVTWRAWLVATERNDCCINLTVTPPALDFESGLLNRMRNPILWWLRAA